MPPHQSMRDLHLNITYRFCLTPWHHPKVPRKGTGKQGKGK